MAERAPKKNGKLAAEGTVKERQTSGDDVAAQRRKPNRGSFGAPGRDPREAAAKSVEARAPAVEEIDAGPVEQEEGMPDQLADMRHVYARPASTDKTSGQKVCRAWLGDNIAGFMAAMMKLEEAFLDWKRDQTLPAVPEESAPDEPLERLIAMVEERIFTRRAEEGQ